MTGTHEGRRVKTVIDIVCRRYDADFFLVLNTRTLLGRVSEARMVSMYACHKVLAMSYVDIAHWFDRADDSVRRACRVVRTRSRVSYKEKDRIDAKRLSEIVDEVGLMLGQMN